MCSIPGERPTSPSGSSPSSQPGEPDSTGPVARLGRAIDELADAAQAPGAQTRDLTERLAGVWELVAELDPELARRLIGYGN
jgi:hypothetical protein